MRHRSMVVCAAALAAGGLWTTSAMAQINLLSDGSFESVSSGYSFYSGGGDYAFGGTNSMGSSSDWTAYITVQGSSTTNNQQFVAAQTGAAAAGFNGNIDIGLGEYSGSAALHDVQTAPANYVPANPGDIYNLSFQVKAGTLYAGAAYSPGYAQIDFYNSSGGALGNSQFTVGTNTTSVTTEEFTGTAPAGTAQAGVYFGTNSNYSVDNFILTDTSSVPEPATLGLIAVAATGLLGRRRGNLPKMKQG